MAFISKLLKQRFKHPLSHCARFGLFYQIPVSPFTPPGLSTHTNISLPPSASSSHFPLSPKMSDDEPDLELLALLRQHLQGKLTISDEPETGVLEGAEYVYDNAIDVAIDMRSCKNAAAAIHAQMQQKQYSPATWSAHELHPDRTKIGAEATVAFIFTMDLLNFSFWSALPDAKRFAIEYRGQRWTGYWSLVAAMQRALYEGRSVSGRVCRSRVPVFCVLYSFQDWNRMLIGIFSKESPSRTRISGKMKRSAPWTS